jgi:predicted heme/steroid binding protein
MNQNFNQFLVKLDRSCAWILFFSVVLFLFSGYGMTKNIISEGVAQTLHLDILPLILIVTFAVHTGLATRMALMRWRIWNAVSMTTLFLIYLSFLIGFGYLEIFFKNSSAPVSNVQEKASGKNDADPSRSKENQAAEKTFTLSELAEYNGQNGIPAYVAVDGAVYDVSTVFKDGKHFSHLAGQDLTGAFYAKHVKSAIAKYPVVGILK